MKSLIEKRAYHREWYRKNITKMRERGRRDYKRFKNKILTRAKVYHKNNKIKLNKIHKDYYHKNRDGMIANNRRWKTENREQHLNSKLLSRRGITKEQYDIMFKKQKGVCAICKLKERRMIHGIVSRFCVDHCHSSGKVRGLLCNKCNIGLGKFNDNPKLLKNALKYITR